MLGAGALNQRITFLARAAIEDGPPPTRAGWVEASAGHWAKYTEVKPRQISIGSLPLTVRAGTLAVRSNNITQTIRRGYAVVLAGDLFEVSGPIGTLRPDGTVSIEVIGMPDRATYAREMDARGDIITLRRTSPNPDPDGDPLYTSVNARAIIEGYQPEELIGGIDIGERRIYVLAQDLEDSDFPMPLRGRTIASRSAAGC